MAKTVNPRIRKPVQRAKRIDQLSDLKFEVTRERVTPKMALEYLDENNFERNRPISSKVANNYAQFMTDGTFASGTDLVFAQVGKNRLVFVDGQHRLSGVARSGLPMEFSIKTYTLRNDAELLKLYSTIDIGFGRTLAHSVRAHDLSVLYDLTAMESRLLTTAVKFMLMGWDNRRGQGRRKFGKGHFAEIIEESKEWAGEASGYFSSIKGCPRSSSHMMRKVGVVAPALATFRARPAMAEEFWRGVAFCEGNARDPRRQLHFFLARSTMFEEGMSANDLCHYVASAWASFCRGREIQVVKPTDHNKQLKILHCKIDARDPQETPDE